MSISTPVLVHGTWYDTTNRTIYDTSAGTNTLVVALVAGRRYYLAIESYSSGGAEAITGVVHNPTGTPLAFSRVTDGTTDARITGYGVSGNTLEVWEVNVTSTTVASSFQITYAGAQSACGAGLFYVTGEDDTNTTVQVKIATGTGTLPAVTMSSFGATDNLALLVVARDDVGASIDVTESRTKLYENDETERNNHAVFYQNPHGSDVSLNASITSDDWAAIGIEVRAAGGGAVDVNGTDSGTLSDNRLLTAAWQTVESATVTDTLAPQAQLAPTDSATLTSETVATIPLTVAATDTGTLAEAATVAVGDTPTADTGGISAETGRGTLDVVSADSLTVTEATAIPEHVVAGVDSGVMTDVLTSVTGDGVVTDTGTLSESIATIPFDVVAAEAAALAAETESAVLTPAGGSPVNISDSDALSLTTEAVPSFTLVVTAIADTGTLASEAATQHLDVVASDSLTVTEVAIQALALIASDAAALADAATLATPLPVVDADTAALAEAIAALRLDVVGLDSLSVSEAIGTIPLDGLTASDSLTVTDIASPLAAWTFTGVDSATLTETELAKPPDVYAGEPAVHRMALAARLEGGP